MTKKNETTTATKPSAKPRYANSNTVQVGELTLTEGEYFQGRFITPEKWRPIIVYENPDKTADKLPE